MSTEMLTKSGQMVRYALNGPTMGSRWSSVFFARKGVDANAMHDALAEAVGRVDQQMSTWKPDSDLSRINRSATGRWTEIPRELATVLDAALQVGRLSDGMFDVGVGDLVQAWGFGAGARMSESGRAATAARGFAFRSPQRLELDVSGGRVRKLAPLSVDLSGIAKGFGVDELSRVMCTFGVDSFLVGIDGELRACGVKPGGRPWAIGHERAVQSSREIEGILELRDMAVATSGHYRHVAVVNGGEVSHTIDPRTGRPLSNDLAAVTVLATSCMVADAWATALLVAGSGKALDVAREQGLSAILVRVDGEVVSNF